MKKITFLLLFLIFTATIAMGCGSSEVVAEYFIEEEDGTKNYLEETNSEVVTVLELIEAYEKVENDYDYRTADRTDRYPYVTEEFKDSKETGRWEQDIVDGEICMEWCSSIIDYIKFDPSFTKAEMEYYTCFTVLECGAMGDSGFEDGATYSAPVELLAEKVDGHWKIADYTFTSKNAERID